MEHKLSTHKIGSNCSTNNVQWKRKKRKRKQMTENTIKTATSKQCTLHSSSEQTYMHSKFTITISTAGYLELEV